MVVDLVLFLMNWDDLTDLLDDGDDLVLTLVVQVDEGLVHFDNVEVVFVQIVLVDIVLMEVLLVDGVDVDIVFVEMVP